MHEYFYSLCYAWKEPSENVHGNGATHFGISRDFQFKKKKKKILSLLFLIKTNGTYKI